MPPSSRPAARRSTTALAAPRGSAPAGTPTLVGPLLVPRPAVDALRACRRSGPPPGSSALIADDRTRGPARRSRRRCSTTPGHPGPARGTDPGGEPATRSSLAGLLEQLRVRRTRLRGGPAGVGFEPALTVHARAGRLPIARSSAPAGWPPSSSRRRRSWPRSSAPAADRDLPFKLTAGLHHALRSTDRDQGFDPPRRSSTCWPRGRRRSTAPGGRRRRRCWPRPRPVPLVELWPRCDTATATPLWVGFGSCSIQPSR